MFVTPALVIEAFLRGICIGTDLQVHRRMFVWQIPEACGDLNGHWLIGIKAEKPDT